MRDGCKMLSLKFEIKGLSFYEYWFSNSIGKSKKEYFGFYCYRDSYNDSKVQGFVQEKKYTLINDLTQSPDALFGSFKSNVRNEIRKCEKIEALEFKIDQSSMGKFIEFYRDFATAKSLSYLKIRSLEKYGKNLYYISSYLEKKLTNMQVYIVDKESGRVRLLHSISMLHKEQDKHKRASIGWINRFLHWKMMLLFKRLGYHTFDWGGYTNDSNSPLAGIDKFKASFGGKKVALYDYFSYPFFTLKTLQSKMGS
jgi:lipid II:glycine glycyltransferase (peptidoglycan interpeptide bridge formation enzyme)